MQWNFWDEVSLRAQSIKGWVKRKDLDEHLRPTPIRHKTLPDKLVERIKKYHTILAEVDPAPPETLIDDFRKDMHPEREVAIWEGIADKYQRRVKAWWPVNKKKELLGKLLQESYEENPIIIGPAEPDKTFPTRYEKPNP